MKNTQKRVKAIFFLFWIARYTRPPYKSRTEYIRYVLVSATEMLKKAKAGHYAVGQFNINNLEWTKAILLTAQELTQTQRKRFQRRIEDKHSLPKGDTMSKIAIVYWSGTGNRIGFDRTGTDCLGKESLTCSRRSYKKDTRNL